ncbi:MAG TPA: FAD-dependent oxidoreductase [Pyrinomonadaceae bacterium]|jgi:demethylphylloquinone reductase|nr:FAD-dependent oxidoreductase [Pyrinomonadaceae bacterium]
MPSKTAKILILGGGFGGLFTALDLAGAGEITLVSDEDHFTFKPMLYEYLSGEVEAWHIAPNYSELLDDVKIVRGDISSIKLENRSVAIEGRQTPLTYDVLVLALGATTNYWGVEGAEQYTLPFRTISDANHLRRRMTEALDRVQVDAAPQDTREALTFVVVGGGASGVELSTKMSDLLRDAVKRRALRGEPRVVIIEMTDRLVPGMGDEIRNYIERELEQHRIEVHTKTRVVRVTETTLTLEHNGRESEIAAAGVVWVAGVRVNPLIENLTIEKDRRGLVIVEPTLQVHRNENVFALGDVAFYPDVVPTLAGTAQLALQQAHLCARNVGAFLAGDQLKSKHFVELGEAVSLGTQHAAVLTGGKVMAGPLARQARFAMYTARLPTWHHRLRVGASWFFEGTEPRPLQPLGF